MDPYVQLARRTVEAFARTGKKMPLPEDLPESFYAQKKGVFVTIHKEEEGRRCLRGCVGTFLPTRPNVAEEILQNAIWASQEDNRFCPVSAEELGLLHYEVSLLEPAEQIYSTAELDPRRYGVIVKSADGRTGLLLPDIEGIDSPLHQVEIAARKAGIDLDREEVTLWRFTVTKHEE
jgi:AmmeMemoRadiSam system protein A